MILLKKIKGFENNKLYIGPCPKELEVKLDSLIALSGP